LAAAGQMIWSLIEDVRIRRAIEWAEAFADDADYPIGSSELAAGTNLAYSETSQAVSSGNELFPGVFAVAHAAASLFWWKVPRQAGLGFLYADCRNTGDITRGAALIREIYGNPFRSVIFSSEWRTGTAVSLARQMYESRDFSAMPILADALQDAGCDNDDILAHCREANATHVRGCWVVDLVLRKK
jgi:hypothetical protein